jgi:hypothetical protein
VICGLHVFPWTILQQTGESAKGDPPLSSRPLWHLVARYASVAHGHAMMKPLYEWCSV